jgi:hypothetical protein
MWACGNRGITAVKHPIISDIPNIQERTWYLLSGNEKPFIRFFLFIGELIINSF